MKKPVVHLACKSGLIMCGFSDAEHRSGRYEDVTCLVCRSLADDILLDRSRKKSSYERELDWMALSASNRVEL